MVDSKNYCITQVTADFIEDDDKLRETILTESNDQNYAKIRHEWDRTTDHHHVKVMLYH